MDAETDALIKAIQGVLTPDLLKPEYREANEGNPLYGHCYTASEVLFHALGGFSSSWRPVRARDDNGVTHWWLENNEGERLDPTKGQYELLDADPLMRKVDAPGF